jgi:hypothetical protein
MPNWIVTAGPNCSAADLAKKLQAIGLTVVRVLDVIGVVEVQGSESLAHQSSELPGVASVEESIEFDIGPPGAETS